MRNRSLLLFIILLVSLCLKAQTTLKVNGRFLETPCGEQVLLRGINKMNIWKDKTGETMSEIAQSGANSVRIVWAGTGRGRSGSEIGKAADLDAVMTNCIKEGMIPIPECHDATGDKWELVPEIVKYWTKPEIVAVLKKHEAYSILNIANEAGLDEDDADWLNTYKDAISKIRATGLLLPIMIDGDHWGQNTDKLFRFGKNLIAHDPEHNVLFSFHPWWPSSQFGSYQNVVDKIRTELDSSVKVNLPLIVGEFAHHAPGCGLEIPHKEIMEMCADKQISWLAWSWGPGNSDCSDMDMTENGTMATFKHGSWAEDVLRGYYGLKRTSKILDYIKHKGECGPYCTKPSLPKIQLVCKQTPITLQSLNKHSKATYTWGKENTVVGTSKNIEVSQEGIYSLTTDSSGCKKTGSTRVINEMPKITLPVIGDLCTKDIVYHNIKNSIGNVTYQWYKDKKPFSKGTFINTNQAGEYHVVATQGSCTTTSNTMTINSPYLTTKDKSIPYAGDVYLKAKGGSNSYNWYKSAKGGTPFDTGKTITVELNNTTTYYVEDAKNPGCKRTPVTVTVEK